jgi:hypothetical protein
MLGFLQIITNMSVSLDIPWPQTFLTLVRYLSVINLDFISISSAECVVPTPYETRVWFAACVPVVVICVLLGGYLLPKYISSGLRYVRVSTRQPWPLIIAITHSHAINHCQIFNQHAFSTTRHKCVRAE